MSDGNTPSNSASRGTALVTGGGVRVGRALCVALAKAGFDVAVHYNSSEGPASETASLIESAGGKAQTFQGDLTDADKTSDLVPAVSRAMGPLSLLVNNASLFENDSLGDFSLDGWHAHMNANLLAPMLLAKAFAGQAEHGCNNMIANIIDQRVWALTPRFFSYTLSKSALWTATRTLAQDLGPRGIRVNAIGPGPTLKNARQSDADWQAQNDALILRKGPDPHDIAAALIYLVDSRAVTGQMIAVDGGQHLAWETPDVTVNE
ncbi:SDR family oxidoreductase [Aquisalinus flavus]|uniref:Short chain dehydrogenase n=1 Tax=Aquisalinus flavus TaxID=1526572 RepID=A0A8J2V7F6_9PROT|nr:SDR family oxidoreductase [Aquisalinus flavus]MBD0426610.1 SDR family oxidoreductase [Aquisalinus flavus]UNE47846.1 SDR family oxidoreductase [Aquisalinus flavus]GGD06526.1 short chain dehydrogenase [Aquisalinus flavus]